MENVVLHLNLMRGMRGFLLAYMVQWHMNIAHIPPEHDAYLNLDKEMITRAPIVDAKLNFKMTQEVLDRVYKNYQCDTFKIDNALVHQILSKIFIDIDAYIYIK